MGNLNNIKDLSVEKNSKKNSIFILGVVLVVLVSIITLFYIVTNLNDNVEAGGKINSQETQNILEETTSQLPEIEGGLPENLFG